MTTSSSLTHDAAFRKIVVASTGLGIALMLASLAAVQFGKAQGLQFKWHWSIALVMVLGVYWNSRFWKVLWQAQESSQSDSRRKVVVAFVLLFALGLGTFLYPMRFVSADHHFEISRGLITAVLFLGSMFWIIFKLGRGFVHADQVETARHSANAGTLDTHHPATPVNVRPWQDVK